MALRIRSGSLEWFESKPFACKRCTLVAVALAICLAAASCSSEVPTRETFFRTEYGLDTHGRKTPFDHLVELDPGVIDTRLSPDYESVAPAHIAVLPFESKDSAQFMVNKIPMTRRSPKDHAEWARTNSNRLRRAIDRYLSSREFLVENLIQVDQIMKENQIDSEMSLAQVSPQMLGQMLGVDAVVYGELIHYEAYYTALVAAY